MNRFAPHMHPGRWLLGCLFTLMILACGDQSDIQVPNRYQFVAPSHFPEPTYTFDNNPVTEAGFKLGKKLFFDPILSVDNTISCGSCHVQAVAFSDPQHTLSVGIEGRIGTRNAPPIANLAFMKEFFWDGGVTHLDFVPLNAIENELEMDEQIEQVIQKLNAHPAYPVLFRDAFDIEPVNTALLLHALSQFMAMMISSDSKYDQYLQTESLLSQEELQGLSLFETHCATCHAGTLFTDQQYRNNGLDSVFTDPGRERISSLLQDEGTFRVPSLRNIAVTAPYMHDGRFETLAEVLDHYDTGVVSSHSLDPILQQNGRLGISLAPEEKVAIITFLKTLTDRTFLSDTLFRR